MMYSVWNHGERNYEYYSTPETSNDTSSPKPSHLRGTTLGLAPESAGWPLPAHARMVGTGKYPKGHIASKTSSGNALSGMPSLTAPNLLLFGGLGLAFYHFVMRPAYSRK